MTIKILPNGMAQAVNEHWPLSTNWRKFNDGNPPLPYIGAALTVGDVVDGELVWQTRNGIDLEWFKCINNKPHFKDDCPELYRQAWLIDRVKAKTA